MPVDKKNIIFPIEFDHFTGGMIHSVVALAKQLKDEYNVYFLAHRGADVFKIDDEIKYLILESPWSISISSPLKTICTYLEVKRLLNSFDYTNTIVFTNNVGSELLFSGFGFFPVPFRRIFVSRGGDYLGKTGWILRKGFKSAYRFIAISESQKNTLIRIGIKSQLISKIHNGVKVWHENVHDSKTIKLYNLSIIGYINSNKNQLLAIDALSELVKLLPELRLNIYGLAFTDSDKEYKKMLEGRIHELGIEDKVVFKGYERNQSEIFNATDILISCSRSEGFGRSVAEAMGYGIPCIGLVSSGGLLDIITNGYDGILIEDDKIELKEAVIRLINDDQFRNTISFNAINTYKLKFTEEIMVNNYIQFLKANF